MAGAAFSLTNLIPARGRSGAHEPIMMRRPYIDFPWRYLISGRWAVSSSFGIYWSADRRIAAAFEISPE